MNYRIKDILKERGVRVEDFANKVGVKRETLSRIINGANTSTETLEKIANLLGVNVYDLYERNLNDNNNLLLCPKCGVTLRIEEYQDSTSLIDDAS